MEDAHATVLELDEGQANSNTFFAVYDGHGGVFKLYHHLYTFDISVEGGTVAKFAGQNVHKRLVAEESYHQKQYKEALKRAFMGTDEDLLASAWTNCCCILVILSHSLSDPTHARDPSGCTAVAVLVTPDGEIYVVCRPNSPYMFLSVPFRPMLAIRDRS